LSEHPTTNAKSANGCDFHTNPLQWGNQNAIVAFNVTCFKYANKLLTNMPGCYIGTCLLCFSKQCIKIFVKGGPGIPSFASYYQMNLTSLTASRDVYQDLFAEMVM